MGERIVRDREIEIEEISKWFQENVPLDWLLRIPKDGSDQYWNEHIIDVKWQDDDPDSCVPLDMTIKKTAVIDFLEKIGVIRDASHEMPVDLISF